MVAAAHYREIDCLHAFVWEHEERYGRSQKSWDKGLSIMVIFEAP